MALLISMHIYLGLLNGFSNTLCPEWKSSMSYPSSIKYIGRFSNRLRNSGSVVLLNLSLSSWNLFYNSKEGSFCLKSEILRVPKSTFST